MLFHTPIFFGFFAAFFAIYFLSKKQLRLQNAVILIGSYIFYGAWDYRFLILIVVSTVTDYLAAIGASGNAIKRRDLSKSLLYLIVLSTVILAVDFEQNLNFLLMVYVYAITLGGICLYLTSKHSDTRKVWLGLSVVVNLGLLGVFKYFNFFAESLTDLAGSVGVELSFTTLAIVLPVGISFYTFQTMSYTIDVYRKKLDPSDKLIEVSAYIAFFPQLVAGPIERGAQLLPQFFKQRVIDLAGLRTGAYLFLWGMFKKAVIADNLAIISDPVFQNPQAFTSGELLVALLAFTFQIYCDFSGYSDMARGIARMMGFNLMVNFKVPYVSRTPSEFWRRWHISLSSWLRDYLYIPLGGNRSSEFKTYRNLFLTMLLGGLWHGASWTFVLWGVAHGSILIIYRLLKVDEYLQKPASNYILSASRDFLMGLLFFAFVVFTWLLFRAQDFAIFSEFLTKMLSFSDMSGPWLTLIGFIIPLWLHDAYQAWKDKGEFVHSLPGFARLNIVLGIVCCILFLQPSADIAFLYFDF